MNGFVFVTLSEYVCIPIVLPPSFNATLTSQTHRQLLIPFHKGTNITQSRPDGSDRVSLSQLNEHEVFFVLVLMITNAVTALPYTLVCVHFALFCAFQSLRKPDLQRKSQTHNLENVLVLRDHCELD